MLVCVVSFGVLYILCRLINDFLKLFLNFFHTNSLTIGETSVRWLFRFYARPTQPACGQVPPSLSFTPLSFLVNF